MGATRSRLARLRRHGEATESAATRRASVARIAAIQQAAGNRATARVLQRQNLTPAEVVERLRKRNLSALEKDFEAKHTPSPPVDNLLAAETHEARAKGGYDTERVRVNTALDDAKAFVDGVVNVGHDPGHQAYYRSNAINGLSQRTTRIRDGDVAPAPTAAETDPEVRPILRKAIDVKSRRLKEQPAVKTAVANGTLPRTVFDGVEAAFATLADQEHLKGAALKDAVVSAVLDQWATEAKDERVRWLQQHFSHVNGVAIAGKTFDEVQAIPPVTPSLRAGIRKNSGDIAHLEV